MGMNDFVRMLGDMNELLGYEYGYIKVFDDGTMTYMTGTKHDTHIMFFSNEDEFVEYHKNYGFDDAQ